MNVFSISPEKPRVLLYLEVVGGKRGRRGRQGKGDRTQTKYYAGCGEGRRAILLFR